jgi:hypothetical protein
MTAKHGSLEVGTPSIPCVALATISRTQVLVQQKPAPPPAVQVGDQTEYEVENIMDVWKWWNRLEYLIKWKGYSRDEWTWEVESQLENAPEILSNFKKQHPEKLKEVGIESGRRRG